jgi:hypothetical protein
VRRYEQKRDLAKIKHLILGQLPLAYEQKKQKPLYINGHRYDCLFDAGINSGVSYVSLSKAMTKTGGAPRFVKGRFVVMESWAVAHKEYFV